MISEAAVVAVAGALYLADCVVLLERGQALAWAGCRRIGLAFGSRHYLMAGKAVALLNPLAPFAPVARTAPLFGAGAARLPVVLQAVRPLAVPVAAQFVLLFLVLPWCLYRAPGWPFFVALLLAYLNAAAMLALIAWRFGRARLPRRALWALGFGWLACLPLSVNCMRKAALAFDSAPAAPRALRFLGPAERVAARAALAAQVEEAMQDLEEDDARQPRLSQLARALAAGGGHGRL